MLSFTNLVKLAAGATSEPESSAYKGAIRRPPALSMPVPQKPKISVGDKLNNEFNKLLAQSIQPSATAAAPATQQPTQQPQAPVALTPEDAEQPAAPQQNSVPVSYGNLGKQESNMMQLLSNRTPAERKTFTNASAQALVNAREQGPRSSAWFWVGDPSFWGLRKDKDSWFAEEAAKYPIDDPTDKNYIKNLGYRQGLRQAAEEIGVQLDSVDDAYRVTWETAKGPIFRDTEEQIKAVNRLTDYNKYSLLQKVVPWANAGMDAAHAAAALALAGPTVAPALTSAPGLLGTMARIATPVAPLFRPALVAGTGAMTLADTNDAMGGHPAITNAADTVAQTAQSILTFHPSTDVALAASGAVMLADAIATDPGDPTSIMNHLHNTGTRSQWRIQTARDREVLGSKEYDQRQLAEFSTLYDEAIQGLPQDQRTDPVARSQTAFNMATNLVFNTGELPQGFWQSPAGKALTPEQSATLMKTYGTARCVDHANKNPLSTLGTLFVSTIPDTLYQTDPVFKGAIDDFAVNASPAQAVSVANASGGSKGGNGKPSVMKASIMGRIGKKMAADGAYAAQWIQYTAEHKDGGTGLAGDDFKLQLIRDIDKRGVQKWLNDMPPETQIRTLRYLASSEGSSVMQKLPEEERKAIMERFEKAATDNALAAVKGDISLLPQVVGLYLRSKNLSGAADFVENPMVFWGGLALVGIGGISLLTGAFDDDDDDDDEEEKEDIAELDDSDGDASYRRRIKKMRSSTLQDFGALA